MRKIAVLCTVLFTFAGLVGGLFSPASADTWTHADNRRDVAKLKFTKSDFGFETARRDRTTDITRISVSHNPQTVVVRVRVRNLTEVDSRSVGAFIRTPSGLRAVVSQTSTSTFVFKGADRAAKLAPGCARVREDFDYASDVVTIVVPRRCLGNPAWVRVGAQMVTSNGSFNNIAIDDALAGRLRMRDLDGPPHLSRKIRR